MGKSTDGDRRHVRISKHRHRDNKRRHSKKLCDSTSEDEDSSSEDDRKYRHKKKEERTKKESRNKHKRVKKKKGRHKLRNTLSPSSTSSSENKEDLRPDPETVVVEIVATFPELVGELEQLLKMVDSGQAVDIGALPDKKLANLLQLLFNSLLLSRVQDQIYLLPEGAPSALDRLSKHLKPNVELEYKDHLSRKISPSDTTIEVNGQANSAGRESATIGPEERPAASSPRKRVIGPAMPSSEMLAAAAKLSEAEAALREAEDELTDSPFIGPPPPALVAEAESANEAERYEEVVRILSPDITNPYELLGVKLGTAIEQIKRRYWKLSLLVHPDKCAHPQAQEAFTAINKAYKELEDPLKRATIDHKVEEKQKREEEEAEIKLLREAAQWRLLRGEPLPGDEELLGELQKSPSRNEWMTALPPERKAGPPSMQSTFFSKSEKSGRGDTSIWTDNPQEKAEKAKMQYLEAYKAAALMAGDVQSKTSEKQPASEVAELVDKYNKKKRSKSLLEKCQDKEYKEGNKRSKDNSSKKETPEWSENHPWKPWDRDKDLAAGRKEVKAVDPRSMSQGLSSRFNSGGSQRTFL